MQNVFIQHCYNIWMNVKGDELHKFCVLMSAVSLIKKELHYYHVLGCLNIPFLKYVGLFQDVNHQNS